MTKELYDINEQPPVGEVPPKMHAWVVRPERFGEPTQAFQKEVLDVPEIADDEVLVYVMAAGVNYNNVWAGLGIPIDVIGARNKAGEPEEYHIGGSDASGIVYKVGKNVTTHKVGDEVVVHCGMWNEDCEWVKDGNDPMYSPTFRIWGYETNFGSFAQFTKVQAHQCLPKPKHLDWASAASYMLVGATAYRMLMSWDQHKVNPGDPVLIWGGAGGLGSMAIQIVKAMGGEAIAVISSDDKIEYCKNLGAKGCINRNDFDHWGMLPHWKDNAGYNTWLKGARAFGKAIWEVLGERKSPRIIFEHPGETTIPTSIFVCDTGGMVVVCAGTTGYNATVDLRYLWMRQKRLQGSHFANDEDAIGFNNLVLEGLVDPCMSQVFDWDHLADSHQLMYENKHPHGNMAILVGAMAEGATASEPVESSAPEEVYRHQSAGQITAEAAEVLNADDVTVKDVMKHKVVTVSPGATIDELTNIMVDEVIRSVVVVKDGNPIGVVSQKDLVLARQGRSREQMNSLNAGNLMTPEIISCAPDTTVTAAVTKLTRLGIQRLFVIEKKDGERTVVGAISMGDVVRYMAGND